MRPPIKVVIIIAAVAAAALVIFLTRRSDVFDTNGQVIIGFSAADFTVYDENGIKHNLSDYAGSPIIVNIWATWCGPCRRELPHFEKFYKMYKDKVKFLMIDSEDKRNRDTVKNFIKDEGYTFPVFYDWDNSAFGAYGTRYIPITIAINAAGEIVYNDTGGLSEKALRSVIESIL